MALLKLWSHLAYRRRVQFLVLAVLLPIGGLAEVISLGAILPLIAVLINPESVFNYEYVRILARAVGILTSDQLVMPLIVLFISLTVLSAFFRIALLWIMTRVAFGCGADLCAKVYRVILHQPYSRHIASHSSSVISGIAGKVAGTAVILQQLLLLLNAAIMAVLIVGAMFSVNPIVAALSSLAFGLFYIAISRFVRHKLQQNGAEIAYQSEKLIQSLQEGLGAIRDVIIDGTQQVFTSAYQKADVALRKAQSSNNVIAASPRFLVEAFGIILITVITYGISIRPGGVLEVLPILGMLVLASQRLLPAFQQIFSGWATIVGMQASLSDALELLSQPMPDVVEKRSLSGLEFDNSLEAESIYFRYSESSPYVLKDVSFSIPVGSRIGLIGITGSGKSTLLDILMGLLSPSAGRLLVDGRVVDVTTIGQWQKIIAHVPQSIYLTDASLTENIAFGVPLEQIDMKRVQHVAKQAQIADFIDGLEYGYATSAGERGARLSGGQRQRIGIARALYKNAKVLMLDEATSALDDATEKYVMDAIEGLGREITILIIAHRLSTLEKCDFVYKMENGSLAVIRNGTEHAVA